MLQDDVQAFAACETQDQLGILMIWPAAVRAGKHIEIIDSAKQQVEVIYDRKRYFHNRGPTNLLRAIHAGKKWWKKHLVPETGKRFPTGASTQATQILLFRCEDVNWIRSWKTSIRPRLGLEKTGFHITDPDCPRHIGKPCTCALTCRDLRHETMRHARLLFNDNSAHWLNHAAEARLPKFKRFLRRYRRWLTKSGTDPDDCCVDNGGTLAAYGIRDLHDLDFLYAGEFVETGVRGVDCHNRHFAGIVEEADFPYTPEDFVRQPANHFYFEDLKFATLPLMRQMKFQRRIDGVAREKDQLDVKRIDDHLKTAAMS